MVEEAWKRRTIPEIPEAEPLVKSLEGSQTLTVRHPYVDGRPLEDGLPRLSRNVRKTVAFVSKLIYQCILFPSSYNGKNFTRILIQDAAFSS